MLLSPPSAPRRSLRRWTTNLRRTRPSQILARNGRDIHFALSLPPLVTISPPPPPCPALPSPFSLTLFALRRIPTLDTAGRPPSPSARPSTDERLPARPPPATATPSTTTTATTLARTSTLLSRVPPRDPPTIPPHFLPQAGQSNPPRATTPYRSPLPGLRRGATRIRQA